MLRRYEIFFGQIVAACDVCILVLSFAAAYRIRDSWFDFRYGPLFPFADYVWVLWIIIPTWVFLLRRWGLHAAASYDSWRRVLTSLTQVQILGGLVLLSSLHLMRSVTVSRLLLQTFLVVSFVGLVAGKVGVKLALFYCCRWQLSQRHALVVGMGPRMEKYLRFLGDHPRWGTEVLGVLAPSGREHPQCCGKPVLGRPRDLPQVLQTHVVDEVIAIPSRRDEVDVRQLALACAERGITFRTLIEAPAAPVGRYHVEEVGGGRYLLSLETVPLDPLYLFLKRLLDVAGATVGLLFCGLVLPWYSFRLRRESPGPVFFCQPRVGQNGRRFTLYKFRTMYPDAEKRLQELRANNEMTGCIFKMKDDPRVTPTGRLLRRRHLDELPQFWNVLKGEMSLVGTRPPTPDEVAQYQPHHYRRLSMKPGITGLWQLNGNGAVRDFEDVVRLDCEYINNWSLWLDCRILVGTVGKVLRGGGW